MNRKFLFSILVFALSLVCGSLFASDTFASNTPLNYLNNYQTSLIGLGDSQGRIRFNDLYSISGSNASYYYIEHGEFQNVQWNWYYGHEYDVIIVLTFEVPNSLYIWNGPIYVDGNNYHTTDDDFNIAQSCDSSTCKYTIIHDLKVSGDSNGQEYVKISNFILKMKSASNITFSGKFNLSAYLIDNVDEAMAFRSDLLSSIDGISSDVSDIASDTSDINRNLQSILDAQNDANDDANDRYQDEKDTIDTNTSGGIDAVEDIDTSINLPSPFAFFLGALSVNSCYDISTLAGMVGSSDTQYCSWFSSSTRTVMTPLIDVIVFITVSMFIWSWVKKGGL